MLMIRSRVRCRVAMRKPRGCAAGAAQRQPDGRGTCSHVTRDGPEGGQSRLESAWTARRRRGTGRTVTDPQAALRSKAAPGAERSSPVRDAVTPRAKTAAESGANIAMPWQVNSVNLPRDERRRVRGTIRRDRGARAAVGGEADARGGRWSRGVRRPGRSEAAFSERSVESRRLARHHGAAPPRHKRRPCIHGRSATKPRRSCMQAAGRSP